MSQQFSYFLPDLLHINGLGIGVGGPPSSGGGPMGGYVEHEHGNSRHIRPINAHMGSEALDATNHDTKVEKSNILLLGPTGSGM